MQKFTIAFAAATVLSAATVLTAPAQAAPAAVSPQLATAANSLSMVEKTQFPLPYPGPYIGPYGGPYGGYEEHDYCFYFNGWHGPGWYWCGYAYRRGYGWGGRERRRGWHYRHHRYDHDHHDHHDHHGHHFY